MFIRFLSRVCLAVTLVGTPVLFDSLALAQQPPAAAQAPRTPRTIAPFDLTGYWVSVVTEEWRWRMMTPPKGDYTSVPLSDEGRRIVGLWDPATDGSCKAYGAAGLMRIPTRLNISWQGDETLKVDTDAGQQTRLLRFDPNTPPGPRSLQGLSIAAWEPIGGPRPGRAGGPPAPVGALRVVTTNLTEGWLRKNGVPYSDATTIAEYWDHVQFPNGDRWLTVTQIVTDPKYLLNEYTTSMHFKREPDGAKWKPSPCRPI